MKKNGNNKVMGLVKWVLPFYLFTFLPSSLMAQDDDLYFVPKKKKVVERTVEQYPYVNDTLRNDVIDFSAERGVYPDSVDEDFKITKQMSRFDDYRLADNEAFWAGYEAGRDSWGWHSPWYYTRFGWYDPWYYNSWSWRYGWYDPWYYGSWRYGWYDPWYYGYAGWYDPWYYGYYGWGGYYRPSYVVVGGSYKPRIGTGTIRRDGSTGGRYGGYRGAVAGNSSRVSSLRHRAETMGGTRRSSGNNVHSGSGNFSGYRGSTSTSSSRGGSFSGSRSSSSSGGSYRSSSGGSRSSGGGFSGGGSRSGGGGGGGGRLGGRR